MADLTLQINSIHALEKLIGGDTKVEVDIRNSVVQAFATKHLKCIANEILNDTFKKEIKKVTDGYIKEDSWHRFTLNDGFEKKIKAKVDELVRISIAKCIDEKIAKKEELITQEVIRKLEHCTFETRVQKAIDEKFARIKKAVNAGSDVLI